VTETIDLAAVWSAATGELDEALPSQRDRAYLRMTHLRAIFEEIALLAGVVGAARTHAVTGNTGGLSRGRGDPPVPVPSGDGRGRRRRGP